MVGVQRDFAGAHDGDFGQVQVHLGAQRAPVGQQLVARDVAEDDHVEQAIGDIGLRGEGHGLGDAIGVADLAQDSTPVMVVAVQSQRELAGAEGQAEARRAYSPRTKFLLVPWP